jgi:hypothetical protein
MRTKDILRRFDPPSLLSYSCTHRHRFSLFTKIVIKSGTVPSFPNPKSQIPNKEVSFGQFLNAFGEEHTAAYNFEK